MATWRELKAIRPDLTDAGYELLYEVGVGLAFLATVRPDGHPRLHPICPIIHDDRVFAFIVPSPKQGDLRRDGRYTLHCFPPPDNEDGFSMWGTARLIDDEATRAAVGAQFVEERAQFGVPLPSDADQLFELDLDACLLTRTTGHGDPAPQHIVWHAADA